MARWVRNGCGVQAIVEDPLLKRWSRAWKLDLITSANPDWDDLYDQLA
jgi:putative endonuclease